MFKYYIFANALRIRKGIVVDVEQLISDKEVSRRIILPAWVELVDKYTLMDRPSYSVQDMLSEYARGNIDLKDTDYTSLSEVRSGVKIIPTKNVPRDLRESWGMKVEDKRLFYEAFMKTDVVFKAASLWILSYKENPVAFELLLHDDKQKAFRIGTGSHENLAITYYSLFVFLKFVVERLGLVELYRITPPIPSDWDRSFQWVSA